MPSIQPFQMQQQLLNGSPTIHRVETHVYGFISREDDTNISNNILENMHQQVPPNPPYSLILQGPSLLLVLYYNVQKEVLKINVYFVSSLTVAAFVQKCVSIQIYCFLPQQLTCCISFYISCEIYLLGSDSSRQLSSSTLIGLYN